MNLPRYENYIDTNLKWIGRIPSHWHLKRLGHHFSERRVKVSDKEYKPLSVTKNGVVPRLETAAKTQDGDNRKLVVKGDFVINSRSDRKGSSGLSPLNGSVSLICSVLVPQNINPDFAHYLLKSSNFQEEYYRFGKGIVADLWSTNFSDMKNIQLPIPTSFEQNRIALFLDYETAKIDALIDEQKRLIELLKEKRQAVISHAVTKGLNPDPQMKDSGVEWLGELPEHWKVAPLKWFSTIRGGLAMGKRYEAYEKLVEYPYLRVANVQSGHFDFSEIKTVKVTPSEAIKYRLKFGEVLMNEGGDNDKLGRGAIWRDDIPNCLHQNHVFAINIESGLLPEWLATFTESLSARAYFYLYSKQSTNLASISSSNVVSCPLPVPPMDEQKSILDDLTLKIDKLDNLRDESIKMMENLLERRSALISAAVTGRIDVRDWQPPQGSDTVEKKESVPTEMQHG